MANDYEAYKEKAREVEVLVAPWLPHAKVTEFRIQVQCGCYSDFTQDPAFLWVEMEAPRPPSETDEMLGRIIAVVEKFIQAWAESTFAFSGCSGCQNRHDIDVRVMSVVESTVGVSELTALP